MFWLLLCDRGGKGWACPSVRGWILLLDLYGYDMTGTHFGVDTYDIFILPGGFTLPAVFDPRYSGPSSHKVTQTLS